VRGECDGNGARSYKGAEQGKCVPASGIDKMGEEESVFCYITVVFHLALKGGLP
jgi:hypothetical protein